MALISSTPAWQALVTHVGEIQATHLRDLLQDSTRNASLQAEFESLLLDFSRQRVTSKTMALLLALAEQAGVKGKIAAMASGAPINSTENRAVMHMALRAAPGDEYAVDGANVVPDVHRVLAKIGEFSARVRNGEFRGCTGQALTDVVAIGIGGSYLGAEFVAEALRTDAGAQAAAAGRRVSFLANVDPVAVARALDGFRPETTLVVIISKTFTTAETMLNARTVRRWLSAALGDAPSVVAQHVVAVSTAIDKCTAFGIDANNIFAFWDWVGGRYSVSSAVGILPLALQFGYDTMQRFLAGARSIDQHFLSAPLDRNLPVLLGLLGVWNASFLGYATRALLPYAQALHKFAPHIQQVDMESNGKRVALDGTPVDFECGPINFGEPGTNGQHSFYQLVHQGRTVPCDFIGFVESQQPIVGRGEAVSNHDELMSNFFAQPDALVCFFNLLSISLVICGREYLSSLLHFLHCAVQAVGKTADELRAERVPEALIPHKVFTGNRPSSSLLVSRLDAYTTGQLLALFEHRTAVEGFVWGINSFDQWGVELGKVLATEVRKQLVECRADAERAPQRFNSSTTAMLQRYLQRSKM